MVAVTAPAGMPCRQFSAAIVGGVWPHTDPASFQSASEAQHGKGVELLGCAEQIRSVAAQVAGEQSGDAITGFCDACHRSAATCTQQADEYFSMARVSDEVGRLLAGLREDLDDLDTRAHAEIDKIMRAMASGSLNPVLAGQQIMAIVAQARRDAAALSTKATAAISAQGSGIGLGDNPAKPGSGNPSAPPDKCTPDSANGMSAGWRRGPAMKDAPAPKDAPRDGTDKGAGRHKQDIGEGKGPGQDSTKPGGTSDESSQGDFSGTGNRLPGESGAGQRKHDLGDSAAGTPSALSPPMSMPGLGSGSSGTPSMPSAGSSGLGGSGLNMPSTPAASTPAGLGGGGLPSQGLSSPAGLGGSGLSGGGGPGPMASSSDFSRGLNAGLGGPAAPFAPPVSPPPSTAAGSAGPAGGLSSAPPPVAAAAGGPAAAGPAVAPGPAMGAGSAVGASGVPAGPLPPFGSDVPRTAASTAAAVSPAAGPPAPAGPAAGGGSTGQVAPLPPGVVGSGVGASAGAATEGVRSSLPDPLLDSASQLVYQLLHDSRMYPYMDWCVGVFRTSSGIETVIVNSEGSGYIPTGVFVPRSARMLFADGGLPQEFRARWFSWANPAETMLAYAELAADHREDIDLWALAVSADDGGSSMPARSVIQHFEDCSRSLSPIAEHTPVSQLDDTHAHRLETMDRALYSRLTGFGDGPLPDRSEAWRTTAAAAQLALARAGAIPDLAVPPTIREVLDLLSQGQPVPSGRWQDLEAAHIAVVTTGAGLRPGRMGVDTAVRAHVLAYHDLARLIELLLLWRRESIAYPEIAYLAGQIHLTPRAAGA